MSKSLNNIHLIGNTGRDPEIRATSSGTRVANLSLATTDGWGDREKTNWHRLVVFGKLVDVVEQYVKKGDRIYVSGRMEYDSYERDGQTIPTAEVVVDQLIMLGSKDREPVATPSTPITEPSDDLPF